VQRRLNTGIVTGAAAADAVGQARVPGGWCDRGVFPLHTSFPE
jgi:hypothetical protein